ncbi:HEAT repeat domain-containing protein, partial [Myxococcota bacterium]|nr:HEAT repeat domain-containing protein [Myxococcota bacterium]MBU1534696.1 HEAT repeat domain-containing protein [Myxococcota bacterium]
MISALVTFLVLAQIPPGEFFPEKTEKPKSFLSKIKIGGSPVKGEKTIWKDTRLDAIRRLLNSSNPRDVIDGLKNIDSVEWEKVRALVLPLIYHLNDAISDLVLQIAVKRREKIASPLLRQRVVFAMSPAEKIAAIHMLSTLGNSDDYGFFNRLLRYQNLKVRLVVIEVVGRMRIHGAVNSLVRLLSDSREQIRLTVIAALGKIGGKQVVVPLISKLSDTSSRVRIAAVNALAPFKSRSAKLALLRLLRTGNATERLAVLKTLPQDKSVTDQLKTILRTGSETERVEAISLLKGAIDNEMLLLLSSLYSYYKYSNPLAAIAGRVIRPADLRLIKPLLSNLQLDYSRRYFLSMMAAGSGLPGSIPLIKALYAKKLLTEYNIVAVIQHASSGEAVAFMVDLFGKVHINYREQLLKSFIERGDDRLAPSFLTQLKKEPVLKKYLLPYAMATGSTYFSKPLLALLTGDTFKNKSGVLAALKIINDPQTLPSIISAGPTLSTEALTDWSNIIQQNLSAGVLKKLIAMPSSGEAMEQELQYLLSAAALKGIVVPAKYRKLPSRKFTYKSLYMWAVSQGTTVSLAKIPAAFRP